MKEEFIPYEQALALKELGFNEYCIAFWTNAPKYKGDNIQLCVTDGKHGYSPNSISFKQDFLREGEVLAPLYQQVFRWFRDKHSLEVLVYKMNDNPDFFWFLIQEYTPNGPRPKKFVGDCVEAIHKTYEEAELECLKKLIEIVTKIKE